MQKYLHLELVIRSHTYIELVLSSFVEMLNSFLAFVCTYVDTMCVVHHLSTVTSLHFSSPQTLLRELELSVVPKLEHKNLLPWFAIISGEKSERRPGQVSCYQIMPKMTGDDLICSACPHLYMCM